MHEASIAKAIIDRVQEHLEDNPAPVTKIKIQIGEFRNVDPECLQTAFGAISEEYSYLCHCQLSIKMVKASATCRQCLRIYHPLAEQLFVCPDCSGGIGQLISGEELNIVSIEIYRNIEKGNETYA